MLLAHLSLRGCELTIHFRFNPQSANTGSTNAPGAINMAAILGGAIGGVVLLLIVCVLFWLRRRRNKKQSQTEEGSTSPSPSPPSSDDSRSEMTMAAITPMATKPRPRVRFGELARPGMEDSPTTIRSETPPAIRPMPSILRRQDSNNSDAPLLPQARMNQPDDQISLASTNDSGPDISSSSLAVAASDSRRASPVPSISAPVRPPRPPQGLFATGELPKFPEPDLSAIRARTLDEDPFGPITAEGAPKRIGSPFSGSRAVSPNPREEMESISRSNTASPAPDNPNPLMLRTENVPQPAPEQRSATTQTRKDLLVALETDQVTTLSRSGTRKVGLPSNPRAGLSRENSSRY